jgi:hypothetical protein
MIDPATLAQLNGEYLMPPNAGPAWHAAVQYGFDMSLVEDAFRLTPEQRLDRHQRALDLILELRETGDRDAAK